MRVKLSWSGIALTLLALASLVLGAPSGAKPPSCGSCRDGTLNMQQQSCPGSASDCTECTVC